MADAVKQCDRFIVVHYVMGKPITNHFENIDGANKFIGLLLSFTGIDAIELIGIVEERYLLKKWGGKDGNEA